LPAVSSATTADSWQEYLSFANGKKVAVADNKIYCATEGGLLY
jgi:hypothetical protein